MYCVVMNAEYYICTHVEHDLHSNMSVVLSAIRQTFIYMYMHNQRHDDVVSSLYLAICSLFSVSCLPSSSLFLLLPVSQGSSRAGEKLVDGRGGHHQRLHEPGRRLLLRSPNTRDVSPEL